MKKKKSFLRRIAETGIFMMPIFILAIIWFWKGIPPDEPISSSDWAIIVGISLLPCLIFWASQSSNIRRINERDGKEIFKYPTPPKDMLYNEPVGFCFGTYNGKYVCKRVDEPGSILVQGSSGSGKSASIIQGFLLNPKNKANCHSLVLDLKHELTDKCVAPEDIYSPRNVGGNTILLDLMDRKNGYGFDPFFMLDENSRDSEVHDTMEVIAQSLIPQKQYGDEIWPKSARQLLRALLTFFYEYEELRTLPAIVRRIKQDNIQALVEKVISTASPESTCYMDIINFKDMASETITSVDMNLSEKIVQFATNQDLVWALGDCPRKCSPKDLLKRSIMLCLPEDRLTELSQFCFLIFNLSIKWMMSLPEKEQDPDRPWLAMILDETVALLAGIEGKMPMLSQCLRIGARGKGCTLLICCQSTSGLEVSMGREETRDMVSNLSWKYILDSTDSATSKEIIGWCGKFMKKRVSANGAASQRKDSTSFSEEDIVTEQDLVSLPKEEEIILISSRAGYLRLKKCFVFKDRFFKPLLDKLK